jgi:methyl-accepting chemotaxis protein
MLKWFLNISTRSKLMLSFGLLLILFGLVTYVGFKTIANLERSQRNFFDEEYKISVGLSELRSDLNRQRVALLLMMLGKEKSYLDRMRQEVQQNSNELSANLNNLKNAAHNRPEILSRLEDISRVNTEFMQTRDQVVIPLVYQGNLQEAESLVKGVQNNRYERIRSTLKELSSSLNVTARERLSASQREAENSTNVFLSIGIISILLGVALVLTLTSAIANPLGEMTDVAENIANGDLSSRIKPLARNDEVGKLTSSFSNMTEYLQAIASEAEQVAQGNLILRTKPKSDKDVLGTSFNRMGANLRDLLNQVQDVVNVLASASTEILSSVSEVVTGATETATSVSETATTAEEVKQTAHVSSQRAKHVTDTARKASDISQAGERSVEETISGMDRIKEQMESIAESIVRLSEQSQAIGEIMQSVNDLAEQSNLLAVNASIEAAKAGEHGKGFTVVAQEVRSLASQSKQATAHVRSILNDIQKATTEAVMATEQGAKAVDQGARQSVVAGGSIRNLAHAISEATQAAAQIELSNQQQLVGMDQVAVAIGNIREASAQNVTSMRQVETAAQDLHDMGQKLKTLVAQYRL